MHDNLTLTQAQELLRDYYGYTSFHRGQETILQNILNSQDVLAIMPTGAGKSLCYQIPALMFPGMTVVISPLISLMKDQVDTLQRMGIAARLLNSSISSQEVSETYRALHRQNIKLLYIAPERLESQEFVSFLAGLKISMVAVDEAHCVSQWGHDFRPSYRRIRAMIEALPQRPCVGAFTATATDKVRNDVLSLLGLRSPYVLCTGFDRANLHFAVHAPLDRDHYVMDYVRANPGVPGIVYCLTRKQVDKLAQRLVQAGLSVLPYHAGLSDEIRRKNQQAFRHDHADVMVATNAFGMGIDKSNVRFVLHCGMPKTLENYYQEAGRAGRDGEKSECVLLYAAQDIVTNRFLIESSGETHLEGEIYPGDTGNKAEEYKKLQVMVDYCHIDTCLRAYILSYFGMTDVARHCFHCSNCDLCEEERAGSGDGEAPGKTDITIEAQKIISCVIRMGNRFGSVLVTQVLRGANTQRIRTLGFQRLSTYGIMREYPEKTVKEIIAYLTAQGYLELSLGEYPVLTAGKKARQFLREKETLVMRRALRLNREEPIQEMIRPGREGGYFGHEHGDLFDRLKVLRKEIAERLGVPPYIVFSDASLAGMCSVLPETPEEMGAVSGVGRYKLEQYGTRFIAVVRKYMEERGIQNRPRTPRVFPSIPEQKGGKAVKGETVLTTFELYKAGKSVAEIAAWRALTLTTIENHLVRAFAMGLAVDPEEFIPGKHREAIFAAIEEQGTESLRTIKEAVAPEVSYGAIRFAVELYKKECRIRGGIGRESVE
ncbi:MAG: DNA helicase RecQ [Peptococcaceae bacterium]|nr:DNA helicase RecQ [Peptococcaceae bacterium]